MAAARQNEMKVSITVVATNTFMAGFGRLGMMDRAELREAETSV